MKDEHLLLLGEIKGTVEAIHEELNELQDSSKSLKERVTSLEKWKAWILGAAASTGLLIPHAFEAIKDLLTNADN